MKNNIIYIFNYVKALVPTNILEQARRYDKIIRLILYLVSKGLWENIRKEKNYQ